MTKGAGKIRKKIKGKFVRKTKFLKEKVIKSAFKFSGEGTR